jgi:hypothetical protein
VPPTSAHLRRTEVTGERWAPDGGDVLYIDRGYFVD